MIEVFSNNDEDGDWYVIRFKESKMIVYEGHSLPPITVWKELLNTCNVEITYKSLNNQQLEDLINESDN